MAGKRGGKRPGAGRKPKPISEIRDKAIEEAADDAKYALGLYVSVMRDEKNDVALRLQCAKEVKDTVWGKPAQRVEATGKDGGAIEVKVDDARERLSSRLAALAERRREAGADSQSKPTGSGETAL
jgi:hypothetical protein